MPNRENDPVDPLLDEPAQINAPAESPRVQAAPVRSGPTFGQRMTGCFWSLVRVTVSVIVLSLFVLALYTGLQWFNGQAFVPAAQNDSLLSEMRSRQEQTEQQLAELQTKLETLETTQNRQDDSLTALEERLGEIETEITTRTQSLEALEEIQSELELQNTTAAAELERQVTLLKSMELLSRARLFMYQSNFGSARQDVQIARDLLAGIEPDPDAPEPLTDELSAVIFRLDLALSSLPDFPVPASDDLDVAWQILLSGLPAETATPATTATVSTSATPSASVTPGPSATVQPTITP